MKAIQNKIIKEIKVELELIKMNIANEKHNHSAFIYYLIEMKEYLYKDLIVDKNIARDMINNKIIKFDKEIKHQELESIRYALSEEA
jgi:hypothetical protein|tara:strand:+ start:1172 stop:1432 length:261 start_codon:yes stop_codon:yes gene_type:complete